MPNDVRTREDQTAVAPARRVSSADTLAASALHDPLEDHTLERGTDKARTAKASASPAAKEVAPKPPPDKSGDKAKKKAPKGIGTSVKGDVSGTVSTVGGSTEMAGGTLKGSAKLLSGKASGEAGAKISKSGLDLSAKAGLDAKLIDFNVTQSWESGKLDLFGEQISGRVYVTVAGMVGAEAKAKMEGNLKAMNGTVPDLKQITAGTGMEVKPDGAITGKGEQPKKEIEASGSGKAEVFAGAKLKVAAGVAGSWHQKAPEVYQQGMVNLVNNVITMIHPGIAWLLRQVGVGVLVGKLAGMLGWKEGMVSLLGLEVGASGSLGLGAHIEAAVGFKGGKLQFKWSMGATWGMGLGTSLDVTLDAKEGVKFALALAGRVPDLQGVATDWLVKNAKGLVDSIGNIWQNIADWFGADVKIREMVAQRVHEVVPADKRAEMVSTLIGGFCSADDAAAVIQILKFTKKKGDMGALLGKVSSGSITWALDGDANTEARALMGVR